MRMLQLRVWELKSLTPWRNEWKNSRIYRTKVPQMWLSVSQQPPPIAARKKKVRTVFKPGRAQNQTQRHSELNVKFIVEQMKRKIRNVSARQRRISVH